MSLFDVSSKVLVFILQKLGLRKMIHTESGRNFLRD